MNIEEVISMFNINFLTIPGVKDVIGRDTGEGEFIAVYVDNFEVIKLLPEEFMGFPCEYYCLIGEVEI